MHPRVMLSHSAPHVSIVILQVHFVSMIAEEERRGGA